MTTSDTYGEIVDFLVDPNHIEHAFDLLEVMPRALDRLHVQFWERLRDAVETQLKANGIDNWTVSFADQQPSDALKDRWFSLELTPATVTDSSLYVCFWCEQDYRGATSKTASINGSAELHYGYGFSKTINDHKKKTLPKEAKDLCDKVPEEWISYKDQLADAGWIALKKVGRDLRARREIVELSKGNTLEIEMAATFLKLFQEKRDKVERANKALIKIAS
jgi:hypothetical protein